MGPEKLLIADPRGFCAGVERAVGIVDTALRLYGSPLYVRKEIVHNAHVVEGFRRRGVVFVDELDEVPFRAVTIFSAHGVSPAVGRQAALRRLRVVDATCPLVTKVHLEAVRFSRQGYTVFLIGHRGHDEVIGTMGEAPDRIQLVSDVTEARSVEAPHDDRVAVVTQTTLSVSDTKVIMDALRARYPKLVTPRGDDICYATQNRQSAVRTLARRAQVVLVVGSSNSSNSNRLREVAQEEGAVAYLVGSAEQIRDGWVEKATHIGLTAGASTPEFLVEQVAAHFRRRWSVRVEEVTTTKEAIAFAPPPELYQLPAAG